MAEMFLQNNGRGESIFFSGSRRRAAAQHRSDKKKTHASPNTRALIFAQNPPWPTPSSSEIRRNQWLIHQIDRSSSFLVEKTCSPPKFAPPLALSRSSRDLLLQVLPTTTAVPIRAFATSRALPAQPSSELFVRSSNVLVDKFFVARVTEYAVGRLLVPSAADAVVVAANADGYRAPALQMMKRYSPRTDVYAFGILLMGRKPSSDLPSLVKVAVLEETTMEVLFDGEVAKGVRSPAEEGLVQALKLAMGCCAPVAAARPSMAEVVRQLEENRPKSSRSGMYSPAETRIEAGTPTITA